MLRFLVLNAVLALAASGDLDDFAGEWTVIKSYGELAVSRLPRIQGCMNLKIQPMGERIKCDEDISLTIAETTIHFKITYKGKTFEDEVLNASAFYVLKNHDELYPTMTKLKATTGCGDSNIRGVTFMFPLDNNYFVLYGNSSNAASLFGKKIPTEAELVKILEKVNDDFKDATTTAWDCLEKIMVEQEAPQ